jgi:Rrf2 family protein
MNTNQQFAVSVHILTVLAASARQAVTSDYIAESVDTNPVVIRRVMGHLREHSLVESRPGVAGGWQLKLPPEQIPLCEGYRAVSHENLLAMHQHPNPYCPIGSKIRPVLGEVFGAAQTALETELGKFTVKDILDRVMNAEEPIYE